MFLRPFILKLNIQCREKAKVSDYVAIGYKYTYLDPDSYVIQYAG